MLEELKGGILNAIPLQPDSDIIIFNPATKQEFIYRPILQWSAGGNYLRNLVVQEVKTGRNIGVPVVVLARHVPRPGRDGWIGAVHLS